MKFMNDIMKTMIPTLIVTKEQIELENLNFADDSFRTPDHHLRQGMMTIPSQRKKHDQHTLLKNPSLIVNDSVKLACENLWQTLSQKVIFKYCITSDSMKFVLNWVHMNFQFLSQIVNQDSDFSNLDHQKLKTNLTTGQYQFLNQNIDLIHEIA